MKKLFVLGTLLTIFLFLFGCQSESPVAPVQTKQDATSLEKPSVSLQIQTDVNAGAYGLVASWNSIGGAKTYELSYTDPSGNTTTLDNQSVEHGTKTYSYPYGISLGQMAEGSWTEGTYTFTVKALNGTGNEKSSAEYSVDFPWQAVTGINGYIGSGTDGSNINVSWDGYSGAYNYIVYLYDNSDPSLANPPQLAWSGTASATSHDFQNVDLANTSMILIRVDAWDASNNLIGLGYAKFAVPE